MRHFNFGHLFRLTVGIDSDRRSGARGRAGSAAVAGDEGRWLFVIAETLVGEGVAARGAAEGAQESLEDGIPQSLTDFSA